MSQQLMQGHYNWHFRPKDQRHGSFDELYNAVAARAARAVSHDVEVNSLRVVNMGGDLRIGRKDSHVPPATMTNWSFGQLAKLTNTPADLVADLSPETAVTVMNERIAKLAHRRLEAQRDGKVKVYLDAPTEGLVTVRAFTSVDYGRVLDRDYLDLIRTPIQAGGWQLPMGYKDGKFGAEMVPTGAYSSDRDLFLFMVDYSKPIEFKGEQLFRGFFTWNSEVGARSWAFLSFLFRRVCGNNIVWGAEGVNLIRVYHRGDEALDRVRTKADDALRKYVNSSTEKDTRVLTLALTKNVAKNDEEAVTFLRENDFTKEVAVASVEAAKREENGAGTLWQLVQGVTAHARTVPHTNARNALEIKAGELLNLVN